MGSVRETLQLQSHLGLVCRVMIIVYVHFRTLKYGASSYVQMRGGEVAAADVRLHAIVAF